MTINFYLDSKAVTKQGERILFCYIRGIAPKKTIKLHTGINIKPINWDKNKMRARGAGKNKLVGAPEINALIDSIKVRIEKVYRLSLIENTTAGYDTIKDAILEEFNNAKQSVDFWEVLEDYLKIRKNQITKGTLTKAKTLKNHLKDFESEVNYPLTFKSMNLLFYDKFTTYLQDVKNHTNNTVANNINQLKIFLNWATDRAFNKFLDYRKFKATEMPTEVIYLTHTELMKLYNYDLSNNSKLDRVRDVFCFACFTGQRFSDISKISHDDIIKNVWYVRTKKTKSILKINLLDHAVAILAKYKKETKPLPVISNQKTNKYLKLLCKKAGINAPVKVVRYKGSERIEEVKKKWEKVATHTARRTFITLSLEKGMRPEVVKNITGHKDDKSFNKYIKIASNVAKTELFRAWGEDSSLKLAK